LLTVTSDNLLTWFSVSEKIPDVLKGRYFFYKLSQVLLFAFIVLTVFTLKDINTKYEKILAEQNSILIDQKEELSAQSEKLLAANEELQVLNQDLGNYKNHLEELVESRTLAFRESESRFRSLFENANDAIFILKNDVFFDCNPKTAEMFGCTKEQLLDSTPYLLSPPKQPDGTDSKMNAIEKINASLKGEPQRFEWQHIKLDGSFFDAEVSLNRIELNNQWFLLAVVHDITERKKIENALKESERKFHNIFDNSKHSIIIIGLDARILAANRAFFELSGYQLEENIPLFTTDIVLPNQRDQIRERLALLSREGSLTPQEYRVKLKNGQIRIIEANTSMMEFEGKNAFLVIIRDVTDIKEAEQKVMEAIINTEENERSRIAQDLHDGLGPVLSTIKLYFQVYQDTTDEGKRIVLAEKLKGTIEEAIKGVSEISHNISPHVLKNYGFYAALKQFVHQIALTKIVNINLNYSQEPELNHNTGIILYRALSELINNSIKHSDCKNISITFDRIEELVQIDYSDDGKGFDVTSVIAGPSRGSGVQNIRNRLIALNGNIEITSTEGRGMHALLIIPV
jgi:PAS domain S-box-containing protein